MQSTWPDLDLNSDSHNLIKTRAHTPARSRVARLWDQTHGYTNIHTYSTADMCCRTFIGLYSVNVGVYVTHKIIFAYYMYNQEYISRMFLG